MAAEAPLVSPPKRMAIALVGPLPPPSGGMANQTEQLARLLRADGMTVEVVQVNPPYRPAWVERIRGLRAVVRSIPYMFQLWRSAGRVDLFHVMANSGWAWHFFAAPAIWVAHLRGIPVIVNYRGGEAEAFMRKQSRWVRPSLRRAATVAVPSAFLQGVFAKWDVATEIVPNIVDLARFSPPVPGARRPNVLVSRNLEPIYDIGTAIRAFAIMLRRHPQARLVIAGSGPQRAELEALCAALGVADTATFTGRIDNRAMAEQCRSAGVLLNPSLADNMPNSLLEAMASGTPIVTTNVGGIPYLVDNERTALLVPPRDPEAMAAAAMRLLDDPGLAARLGATGLDVARQYTWASVQTRLYAVYARALRARSPADVPMT